MNKRRLVEMISNIALKELARIPSLFKLASTDPSEIERMIPDDLKKSSTAKNIISYYQDHNNEPSSVMAIASHYGHSAQQPINTQFQKLKNAGVLVSTGLAFPKAEKPLNPGPQGRPVQSVNTRDDDAKLKYVIGKLKNGQEPQEEYKNWFSAKYSSENYEKLKTLVDTFNHTITKDKASEASQAIKTFLSGLGFIFKKRGRRPGETPTPIRTPGDDGFDNVNYISSEDDEV